MAKILNNATEVVVRKVIDGPCAGDTIVFFPGTEGEYADPSLIQSYMHVGQHAASSKEFAIKDTVSTLSGVDGHGSILKELEEIGYKNIIATTSIEELGYKPKCLYCNSDEPTHFICESCGDGMCEECYQAEIGHYAHYQDPAESAETEEALLALEDAFGNGYGCEKCVNKVLKEN